MVKLIRNAWFLLAVAAGGFELSVFADEPARDESFSSVQSQVPGWDLDPKQLPPIQPGTRFGEGPPEGWSHRVLFVKSRLGHGDLDAVPETVTHYSSMFNPVILANTKQDGLGKYYLQTVAVGTSMRLGAHNTVISSDTQKDLGANLNIIGRGVLSGNERELSKIQQIARSSTSMIVDGPIIMLQQDNHRDMVLRLAIWVASESGEVGTTAWLLDQGPSLRDDYTVADEAFQFLPHNMHEDRVLNVKKDRFRFGIPARSAFAMVRIPQGTAFRFTPEMQEHAGRRQYNGQQYLALWSGMSQAMNQPPLTTPNQVP